MAIKNCCRPLKTLKNQRQAAVQQEVTLIWLLWQCGVMCGVDFRAAIPGNVRSSSIDDRGFSGVVQPSALPKSLGVSHTPDLNFFRRMGQQ